MASIADIRARYKYDADAPDPLDEWEELSRIPNVDLAPLPQADDAAVFEEFREKLAADVTRAFGGGLKPNSLPTPVMRETMPLTRAITPREGDWAHLACTDGTQRRVEFTEVGQVGTDGDGFPVFDVRWTWAGEHSGTGHVRQGMLHKLQEHARFISFL
jgi:hypothetical protein